MADVLADGMTRVSWVGAIANINSPTAAELNAGIQLQYVITPDGLMGFEATTAEVDNSALASTFDTKTIGRDSYSGTGLRMKKQTAPDTARNTLTRGTSGFIAIRRDLAETTAWASGQPLEVYPVTCGRRKELAPEANSVRKYEVPTPITLPPATDAVVA
ncbi:hypothetical protein [Micromonospora robiginosa]|uniref:Uncharacterized protein n=1 Tax=Micromonospora robiginosa TaxID=2749844 RepID=A0A7L6B7K8_9ACTN|nr:hypothetical protein [Micromonospora ferruginea]QLQ37993.1 hypothetical protein H1D33_03615 [Micromonospora ferruginea]